jgi:hypothetical protein
MIDREEYFKNYRKDNKERINKRYRIYCKKNRERINKNRRLWNSKNKDKIKLHNITNILKNKKNWREYKYPQIYSEEQRLKCLEWRRSHPEQVALYNRKNKSKRRSTFGDYISIKDQKKIIKRDKVCVYCSSNKKLQIDHIIPLSKKGTNCFNNLVLSCRYCNYSKKDINVFEWCWKKEIDVPILIVDLLNRQIEQQIILT